nr:immunoglobulin heavy chain junction region [Mus musculus]MBK4196428.1 immunoglobulin heavy chain junction region [Mus musculus]MBK4196429.1 immunoglobulin heavy chain junction region [Mus musculus]
CARAIYDGYYGVYFDYW